LCENDAKELCEDLDEELYSDSRSDVEEKLEEAEVKISELEEKIEELNNLIEVLEEK
jgi:predicted RNase H-like nuclease (RuvC/YqgF family)